MQRCLRAVHRAAGRRCWSDGFRQMMQEEEVDCHLGRVPYYEGHPLVAVLFGWPGATEQTLRPYSELYDRMGVPSVMVLPWWREARVLTEGDLRVQRLFAELQVELCNLRTDLVLHFFSASHLQYLGACVYLGRRIMKGVVFDSGPVPALDNEMYQNATRTMRAAEVLAEQGTIAPVSPLRRSYTNAVRYYKEAAGGWTSRARELTAMEMVFAPQLFLRCENDPLLPENEFQQNLENQRDRKELKVWEVTWPGNRHCGHLEAHPEEYESVLRDFVMGIKDLPVEQLEVGRGAGAEWPPSLPTDEEMLHSYKWARPYLSPYHKEEVEREERMSGKRVLLDAQKRAVREGSTLYRYPDGSYRDTAPSLEETQMYIAENTPDMPAGVVDLRGRQDKIRTPINMEHGKLDVMPARYYITKRDLNKK
eukprot:TRINITY_DN36834_c0_g1_i1.p1 TRINITY_DN36834_c0_g1~~TRINITY_DN36834_c0_g1_i1.p1  ORF type:complete len:422 (+),score=138.70 TRINITY_DN36834_c0_g1_i1:108-1373(+)